MRLRFALLAPLFVACGAALPAHPEADAGADGSKADGGGTDAGEKDGSSDTADANSLADGGAADTGVPLTEARVVVHYPASAITVRGSAAGLSWAQDTPAAKVGDAFVANVHFAPTDGAFVEWKPMKGAVWARGPNYVAHRGEETHVFPHFTETAGRVTTFRAAYTSPHLPQSRPVFVYVPPTALENSQARFPVVYMHDGQNLFDPALSFGGTAWEIDQALDRGAEDGTIAEAIVVGVGNSPNRNTELTPTYDASEGFGGEADSYLAMIADDLKPLVDGAFPTIPDRMHTAIMGSSLGGLVSLHAGKVRPETFALVGALSPSTWWDRREILGEVATLGAIRPSRFYVDSGDSGPSSDDVTNTRDLAAALVRAGYVTDSTLKYVMVPGDTHTESAWQRRAPGAFAFLLGPGR